MNVIAKRFARTHLGYSGGAWMERTTEMRDAALPADADEAAQRSRKAVLHHWPDFAASTDAVVTRKPKGWFVSAPGWSVTWKLPGYDNDEQGFIDAISGATFDQALRTYERLHRKGHVAVNLKGSST